MNTGRSPFYFTAPEEQLFDQFNRAREICQSNNKINVNIIGKNNCIWQGGEGWNSKPLVLIKNFFFKKKKSWRYVNIKEISINKTHLE